ncbi:UNVERIFIED_CONTAM: Retrovirus-related Pol polyprotein from transposon RE1 [Sesamum indicum]
MQFLMGLGEPYDSIRSQILVLDSLPNVNKAYSMVLRVERQRLVNLEYAGIHENSAMQVKGTEFRFNSWNKNYMKKKGITNKRSLVCDYCNKQGHNKDSCFKLHGFPDWYKDLNEQKKRGSSRAFAVNDGPISMEKSQRNELLSDLLEALQMVQNKAPQNPMKVHFAQDTEMAGTLVQNNKSDYGKTKEWIVDSGATNHMSGDGTLFHSLSKLHKPIEIHLRDNSTSLATHNGNITLFPGLTLMNVLLIPKFQYNLLSVSQFCKQLPVTFTFLTSSCVLQDQMNKRIMAVGKQIGKLYFLDYSSFASVDSHPHSIFSAVNTSNTSSNYAIWHKRLGHANSLVLSHISDLNITDMNKDCICSICPKAKQTRKPFPSSTHHAVKTFDLIHMDVWGPYKQSSISGGHYILTIVDDFSRTTWTYIMHHKSQTTVILSTFLSQTVTQFGTQIKCIQTDNGTEFLSSSFQELLHKNGIIHEKSCVYTPQQNGVVERKHRHLLEVARALMFQSYLPDYFWAEAILTATHIINKLPSAVLSWRSSHELLFETSPSYAHLKTFGCLCFASNTLPHKSKFTPRAFKCVFIGYVQGQKAFKLYDLDNKKVIISRDVTFHEDIFPYQNSNATSKIGPVLMPTQLLDNPYHQSDSISSNNSDLPLSSSSYIPDTNNSPISAPAPRRSQRPTKPPAWLNDFHCNSSASVLHPSNVASSHIDFLAALSTVQEPSCYKHVQGCKEWEDAMRQELQALEDNDTWEIVDLPKGKKAIGCKWVYKVKLKADGSVDRYKARLVAKGYNQVEGVDYIDRFSPMAKAVTVRIFLADASSFNWRIHQVDINNAFLHGYLDEVIYMHAPDGYSIAPNKVCKLKRSLYGLKQASRQWNLEFTTKLIAFGFTQSPHDHCLFTKQTTEGLIALIVYVDDVLITCSSVSKITEVKQYLHKMFTIKDLGPAKYFLGLEIARSSAGTSVTQHKFIRDIILDSGLSSARPALSPLPTGLNSLLMILRFLLILSLTEDWWDIFFICHSHALILPLEHSNSVCLSKLHVLFT